MRQVSDKNMGWARTSPATNLQRKMRKAIDVSRSAYGAKNLFHLVSLPARGEVSEEDAPNQRTEICEWMAENVMHAFYDIAEMLQHAAEDNEEWDEIIRVASSGTKEDMKRGYPRKSHYKWNMGKQLVNVPVDVFIKKATEWIYTMLDSKQFFPSEETGEFLPEFEKVVKKICKRTFRLYAIMLSNKCLLRKNVETVDENPLKIPDFTKSFNFFLFFCWRWDLLQESELRGIKNEIAGLQTKFKEDKQLYDSGHLPMEETHPVMSKKYM